MSLKEFDLSDAQYQRIRDSWERIHGARPKPKPTTVWLDKEHYELAPAGKLARFIYQGRHFLVRCLVRLGWLHLAKKIRPAVFCYEEYPPDKLRRIVREQREKKLRERFSVAPTHQT